MFVYFFTIVPRIKGKWPRKVQSLNLSFCDNVSKLSYVTSLSKSNMKVFVEYVEYCVFCTFFTF